jgi:hypothetical protein
MYRLPNIGKPRTAGPGKSHRPQSGPKKGKPAGQPAKGAVDNHRPQDSGGQWQCKTETLLQSEQRFVHCRRFHFPGKSAPPVHRKYTCQLEGFAVVSELPIKAADAGHPLWVEQARRRARNSPAQFNSYIAVNGESSHRKRTTCEKHTSHRIDPYQWTKLYLRLLCTLRRKYFQREIEFLSQGI